MDLATVRGEIDAIDDEILRLLNERARLVHHVASLKERQNVPFYVPSRERAIVDRLKGVNPGPFPSEAIRPVFQEIFSACLSLEVGVGVAFLGPEATFTHMAVKQQFGLSARGVPVGTIDGVFQEVIRGAADYGVVPVENSSEGVVNHTLDSFVASDLRIAAEILLEVNHCLLVQNGVGQAAIERVYSHPQALAQCRKWIATNLPSTQIVEAASTAAAARLAREDARGAAIASEMAARMYDLEILRHKIEDAGVNMTRFLVLGRKQAEPTGHDKTTLLLGIHDTPGILFDVLKPFADRQINMSRIESRPSRQKVWEYLFFIDVDGHELEPKLSSALDELRKVCRSVKVLGSYPRAKPLS